MVHISGAPQFLLFFSFTSDPVDVFVTGLDCVTEGCSGWAIVFGVVPLLPGSKADEIIDAIRKLDGTKLPTDDILDLAIKYLDEGYVDKGNGRFVSADELRQVRMSLGDITGSHKGGSHINFDLLAPNPKKPGKMTIVEKIHLFLEELLQ